MADSLHKTLVIRFSSIGDIVLAGPLLRGLRRRFPGGQIDFVTKSEFAELVRSNHNINYTYAFDARGGFPELRRLKERVKAERYDLIVDLHGSLRSRFLRSIRGVPQVTSVDKRIVERTALVKLKKNIYRGIVSVSDRYLESVRGLGVEGDGKGLELHVPDEALFGVNARMAAHKLHHYEHVFGLCPGARHMTKRWPIDRYSALAERLVREQDAAILVFGDGSDRPAAAAISRAVTSAGLAGGRVIDLTGELSLIETAAAMEYAEVVVTNDSGLMHVASARQRPVVAVFGSTVKEFGFFPQTPDAIVLEVDGLPCRPCSHIGRAECPEGHFRCMLDVAVERTYQAVVGLLRAD